ncbi:RsmD family RNA methyltransferase [Infirmifilum lucidum]|uniref:RsmD family RNA methyltransferase n=1 Tax=Infirmifilum lucidum TaxID=2776706 RepID=A0A7L9FEL6_9CREN|nr:RsmD family RNA methyltransferase [Infirmifilum lucidum]QOJ78179.1 RsmD family RNA methyltransferase [Infirmifilum lucidum]
MSRKYLFKPRPGITVTPGTAKSVLCGASEASIDYGLGRVSVKLEGDHAVFEAETGVFRVSLELLRGLAEWDRVLFVPPSEEPYLVEVRGEHYYKLKYLGELVAPTLEIDGVHMHNIVGTTPTRDAMRKISLLKVKEGEKGLDVCTGLGYTAIEAWRRGAEVVTVEADANVLYVAEHNPFSRQLEKVEIVLGDAFQVLDEMPEEEFDFVLHDPPVFAFAPRLYSREFYLKLTRILKEGGRLFHYTGAPGKHRGIDIQRGVIKRLREAGFAVTRVERGYGVVAVKV